MKKVVVRAPETDRKTLDLLELSDIPPIPTPTPGIIPPGTVTSFLFSGAQVTSNSQRHMNADGNALDISPNTVEIRVPMPYAGTIMNFITQMDLPLPNNGAPTHAAFVLRKNGVGNDAAYNTAIKTDWLFDDIGKFYKIDGVHTVDVVAGDMMGVYSQALAMGGLLTNRVWCSFMLVAT